MLWSRHVLGRPSAKRILDHQTTATTLPAPRGSSLSSPAMLVMMRMQSRSAAGFRRFQVQLVASPLPTKRPQPYCYRYLSSSTDKTTTTTTTTASTIEQDTSSTRLALLLAAAAGSTACVVKYFHDHFGGTEGLWRACQFYSIAIPKYFAYRYHQMRGSPDHVWDELDRETSAQGLDTILRLKGFYVKCGQLVGANIGNAFSTIWQDTMSVLQDQVPPEDFESVIRPILEEELDFEGTFASIDPVPIGSASIGQVHRATLKKDGTPVVVKVCYPHVERLLRGDVRTIRAFCEVAQPVHVPGIKEIEKQFPTEFDYRIEAANLEKVRQNLERAGIGGRDKLCIVPKPHPEYCTKHVLVMEALEGDKLVDALREDGQRWAEIIGRSELALLEYQQSNSRSAQEINQFLAALDAKRRARNAWTRLYNMTVGLVTRNEREYQLKDTVPLNHAQLVDDLIRIHGHEVLVDGVYNADCHPGNILLCRKSDGSPQLGLIDYGQVQFMNKEQRHLFCRIIIALDDDDHEEVVRLMKEAGFKSERMDPEVIYIYAKVSYDQDNKELTNGKHIQMFMEDLQSRDPIIQLPEKYMMIGRTSILLRGLAHALKQSRSVAKLWRPIAERVLKEDI